MSAVRETWESVLRCWGAGVGIFLWEGLCVCLSGQVGVGMGLNFCVYPQE